MDESAKPIDIGYYVEAALRRRWLIIIPFCMIISAGIFLAIFLPKIYAATTLILVQPQKVPTDYVRPVVSMEIEQRISTISQQIMSRTSLENIINQFNLFMEPKHDNMFMEDKIENLRERIDVDVITDRRQEANAFSISFTGKDPQKVMSIANALATYFINENLKQREAQAVGTSDFLDDELQTKRKQIEELEKKLKTFRETHMGGLPEQLETNLRILDRLQLQSSAKQENLRDAKNRLISLNNQLSQRQNIQQPLLPYQRGGPEETETDPYLKLQKLNQELIDLQNKYTERHPDVIRLKRQINDVEEKINADGVGSQSGEPGKDLSDQMHPVLAEQRRILMQQRDEIKLEIQKLESEGLKLLEQIAYYQRLVEDTPKKEQELLSIQRDYDNLQKTYDSLLESKVQAQMAVNMEKKQQGEQFRIIDPARLPMKPIKPKMDRLFMLTVIAGLGFGFGLVFILEYLDTSIRRKEDLEEELGIPLLATIPKVYHSKDIMLKRINNFLTVISLLIAFSLFASFGALVFIGVEQTIEVVHKYASVYGISFLQ
jgi:polysaccharide chain length determinant protein (PEP-CTERM system associated)